MWRHIYRLSLGWPNRCEVTSIDWTKITLILIRCQLVYSMSPNTCSTFFNYNLDLTPTLKVVCRHSNFLFRQQQIWCCTLKNIFHKRRPLRNSNGILKCKNILTWFLKCVPFQGRSASACFKGIAIKMGKTYSFTKRCYMDRGGGQVVSMLAFYSYDPSSNPTKFYNFFCKILH